MSNVFIRGSIGVENGYIKNSPIDMNNIKITNLHDPVNDQDAVNLRTLRSHNNTLVVTLAGINPVTIDDSLSGSFFITISGSTCASFAISKADETKIVYANRYSSSRAPISGEQLEIKWGPEEGMKLNKDGIGYDGEYIVKIM